MKRKIIILIATAILVIAGIAVALWNTKEKGSDNQSSSVLEETNKPIQFGESETSGPAPYTASDYVQNDHYPGIPEASGTNDESEDEISEQDVLAELYRRAETAGIDTDKVLSNEDAATISDQKYQTLSEYKEYLKNVLAQKRSYADKADAFEKYMEAVAADSQISGYPEEQETPDEEDLRLKARELGFDFDQIKNSDGYESFKESVAEKNDEEKNKELILRYIAEKEGVALETGDDTKMLDFYELIYGKEKADEIRYSYTEAQIEMEALYYKLVTTLF